MTFKLNKGSNNTEGFFKYNCTERAADYFNTPLPVLWRSSELISLNV